MSRTLPYVHFKPNQMPSQLLEEYRSKLDDIILFQNPLPAEAKLLTAHMARVDGRIYLGAFEHASDKQELATHGITHVLNCARSCCPNHDASYYEPEPWDHDPLTPPTVCSLDIVDHIDYDILHNHFDEAWEFLEDCRENPKANCLIHCRQGQNRSATLCIAYLMIKHQIPLLSVVKRVHTRRPYILGNMGFRKQLIEFAFVNGLLTEAQRLPQQPKCTANVIPFDDAELFGHRLIQSP